MTVSAYTNTTGKDRRATIQTTAGEMTVDQSGLLVK